jgi:hypothetical protein
MVFGPWMNSQNEVDFDESASVQFKNAAIHTQWQLIDASVSKKAVKVSSKDKKYSSVFPNLTYFFIIERHSALIFKVLRGIFFHFHKKSYTTFFNFFFILCHSSRGILFHFNEHSIAIHEGNERKILFVNH